VYDLSTLVDILSKREHFYRTYMNSLSLVANLPSHMSASPSNPLIHEITKGYGYINPTSFSAEISREVMYTDLNFLKLNLLVDFYKNSAIFADKVGVNISFVNN
jgi:hypothetical protein